MKVILTLIALTLTSGILKAQQNNDMIFHYSAMDAMRNGVYTGNLNIADASEKGDFGLGTYNQLDGELIALDGIYYRVAADGKILKAEANRKIPFASLVFFKVDSTFTLTGIDNLATLQQAIMDRLPSTNRPYSIRINLTFKEVATGGATKLAEEDITPIAELMKTRPVYKKENVSGTIIGFYNPAYIGGVDLFPFHFHFLSNDAHYGGHLISGQIAPETIIKVSIDEKAGYHLVLPDNNKQFDKNWNQSPKAKSTY